tara:strand:+ start:426 stop:590 length:165 start_codon:yes stop_codon:yes gene_type:complete
MQMDDEDTIRAEAMAEEAKAAQSKRKGPKSTIVAGGLVSGGSTPTYGGTPTILG